MILAWNRQSIKSFLLLAWDRKLRLSASDSSIDDIAIHITGLSRGPYYKTNEYN